MLHRRLLAGFLPLALICISVNAQADSIIVDTLADPGAETECSLRSAVDSVNAGAGVDGCADPVGERPVIEFAAGLGDTLTLDAGLGQIEINTELEISGPGAEALTIDATESHRHFYLPTDDTVIFRDLHLANGRVGGEALGGAILNRLQTTDGIADVRLLDMRLTDNEAHEGGAVAVNRGGAAGSCLRITVTGSEFEGNTARSRGGAIWIFPSSFSELGCETLIEASRFVDNEAEDHGGVFATDPPGAGRTIKLRILGSEFEGNQAGNRGGAVHLTANLNSGLEIAQSSFAANKSAHGGALWVEAAARGDSLLPFSVLLEEVVFEDNSTDGGHGGAVFLDIGDAGQPDFIDSVELKQVTLTGNDADGFGGGMHLETEQTTLDLREVSFGGNEADRGGGLHLRNDHCPEDSPPLLVEGWFSANRVRETTELDNRGGGGAYLDPGDCDLLVHDSTFNSNEGKRIAGAGLFVLLSEGDAEIVDSTFFQNEVQSSIGDARPRMSGGGLAVFSVDTDSHMEVRNSNFTANSADTGGGAGFLAGNAALLHAYIGADGSAEAAALDAVVVSSRFDANKSLTEGNNSGGGGILFYHEDIDDLAGDLLIESSLIARNTAGQTEQHTGWGGGLSVMTLGDVDIINSTIANNSAFHNGGGGGLVVGRPETFVSENIRIRHTTISGNRSESDGGGVYLRCCTGDVDFDHALIADNSSDEDGPDIYIEETTGIILDHSLVGDGDGLPDDDDIDIIGPERIDVDARLLGLADWGGAFETVAPGTDSPAIDGGDPALDDDGDFADALPYDLRGEGFARIVGDAIDIGAFELQPEDPSFIILQDRFEDHSPDL